MPHHFTKSTVEASVWCPTCNKMTMHFIWDGRIGRCKNEHPRPEKEEAQSDESKQQELF